VVVSGNGLHVYWPLSEAIDPETWLETAKRLKRMCEVAGLYADPSRTADVASILRPVGTMNRKDASMPLPVVELFPGETASHPQLASAIERYLTTHNSGTDDFAPQGYGGAGAIWDNSDLRGGMEALQLSWFGALAPADKDACLAEMLAVPDVAELADRERGEWLRIVMACARSGAPDAEEICKAWSQTSARYDAGAFERDWQSACRDAHSITIGTLISMAKATGWDAAPWRAKAEGAEQPDYTAPATVASLSGLDMARFSVAPLTVHIPPRAWMLGRVLVRGQYTMLAAPGGRGKSGKPPLTGPLHM
jgi:hypothetical protein